MHKIQFIKALRKATGCELLIGKVTSDIIIMSHGYPARPPNLPTSPYNFTEEDMIKAIRYLIELERQGFVHDMAKLNDNEIANIKATSRIMGYTMNWPHNLTTFSIEYWGEDSDNE